VSGNLRSGFVHLSGPSGIDSSIVQSFSLIPAVFVSLLVQSVYDAYLTLTFSTRLGVL
jgi:hypothetical protein